MKFEGTIFNSYMSSDVLLRVESIWELRNEVCWQSAYKEFQLLLLELDIDFLNGFSEILNDLTFLLAESTLPQNEKIELILDLISLHVSFVRRQSGPEESLRLCKLALTCSNSPILRTHSRLEFQVGLNEHARENFWSALRSFQIAEKYAKNDFDKMASAFNSVLCYENLGCDYSQTLCEATRLQQKINSKAFAEQFLALEMRQAFREGSIEKIEELRERANKETCKNSQSYYQAQFLNSLDHFQSTMSKKLSYEYTNSLLVETNPAVLYQGSFRSKTILEIFDPTDHNVSMGEKIDRLYLWTWKFLKDPSIVRAAKLLSSLTSIQSSSFRSLSPERYGMLLNACQWLSLFSPLANSVRARLLPLAMQNSTQSTCLLLKFEYLVIEWIKFARMQNRSVCDTLHDAIQDFKHLHDVALYDLYDSLRKQSKSGGSFRIAGNFLNEFIFRVPEPSESQLSIQVDMNERRMSYWDEGKINSYILTNGEACLLRYLSVYGLIDQETYIKLVWDIGFWKYEFESKIANHLTSFNKKMPFGLRLLKRSPHIVLQNETNIPGKKYTLNVVGGIYSVYLQTAEMDLKYENRSFLPRGQSVEAIVQSGQSSHEQQKVHSKNKILSHDYEPEKLIWMNRKSLESHFSISRASANRRLDLWFSQKKILKNGNGKSTVYGFTREFLTELTDNGQIQFFDSQLIQNPQSTGNH